MSRPVQVQISPGAATVAVELIALASPVPEPVAVPPPTPPAPEPPAPPEPEPLHDEVLQEDEMAVQHKALKKKPIEKKPTEKKQAFVPKPAPVTQQEAPVAAPVAAPAPIITARYDADYLKNPPPLYPSMSRRLSEEGRVLLRVQVSPTGNVMALEIKQSSGFMRLDEAARKAVTQWRFSPARQGDTAMVSWVEVPIQFSLQK